MEQNPDFSQLMKLAQSDAGRQLMQLLRQNGGKALDNALSQAAAGDYSQARAILSGLLANPDAHEILKELEDRL